MGEGMPELKVLTAFEERVLQLAGEEVDRSCVEGEVETRTPSSITAN